MFFRVFVPCLLVLLAPVAQAADAQLAKDVEALRNSLPVRDPARPTLTLRLADVLFDQSVELAGDPMATDAQNAQVASLRKRSLALYQEALSGTQFHPPAGGALAHKIQFQIARLQQEMGQVEAANKMWKVLVAQQELQDLRREAALRLAEYYEKLKTPAALKESDVYYRLAIELCGSGDVCAYGHYRRAWALREAGNLPAAIDEMQVALFDSKGQPREEALRDLLVFLAAEKTDGERALLMVEELVKKTGRPALFEELAEAFYSAGNRVAGTRVLELVNQRNPTIPNSVRLMEEYYGLRNWEKFRLAMDQTARLPRPAEGVDSKTEKILRRLSVQLDGERASRAQYAPDFQAVVLLYMQLFPKHPDQFKLMEGWLASETDVPTKIKKIDEWVNGPDLGLALGDVIKLREMRLAMAGKEKDSAVVQAEAAKLAALVKDAVRANEYRYIDSVAQKEQGKAAEALAYLRTWAKPEGEQDVWTVRGGLLTVDILVEQKNYPELVRVTDAWLKNPKAATVAKNAKDKKFVDEGLAHLARVREEARFEATVAMGETPEALATFEKFCQDGKFLPKSCENGRVLAVKLKNQKSILALLKATNQMKDLAAEYEAAGFFAEAAELQEKELGKAGDDAAYLKVALLYELGSRFTDRNRLLGEVTKRMKARKSAGENEDLIYATLKDAGLLGPEALDLPWGETNRLKLSNQLELEGKGSERTRRDLLASTRSAGLAWSKHVLSELVKQDSAQRKVTFYGRQGQVKFKQRLAALEALDALAVKYFPGADSRTRVRIGALLRKAYADFSAEILGSPMPAELSPEMLEEVKASLTAMAEPFGKKAQEYEKLARDQFADVGQVSERAGLEALLLPDADAEKIAAVEWGQLTAGIPTAPINDAGYKNALGSLHDDPTSVVALSQIKDFYTAQGKERLASYFQGRLLQLGSGKGEKQ